jgi:acetate kinase
LLFPAAPRNMRQPPLGTMKRPSNGSWAGQSNRANVVERVDGVGHRVVHGGDRFLTSVLIDDRVLKAIEALSNLAQLHNPASVSVIRVARRVLGSKVPMVAVFDTSFHRPLPDYASTYAIPHELTRRHRIQRYGFHGLAPNLWGFVTPRSGAFPNGLPML